MTSQAVGERIKRNEDPRLLTGRALFVDDISLPGMLHVAFVRSPYAHALIKKVDVSEAARAPGVEAVFTGADLQEQLGNLPVGWVLNVMDADNLPQHPPLLSSSTFSAAAPYFSFRRGSAGPL